MQTDPFISFLSDFSKKIQTEKEHKILIEKINSDQPADNSKASLENVILTIKEKIAEQVTATALPLTETTQSEPLSSSIVKRVTEEENNFGDFVSKLKNILNKDVSPIKEETIEQPESTTTTVVSSAAAAPVAEKKASKKSIKANSSYIEVLEQLKDGVAIEKEDSKVTEIKKLIEEYAEKYIKKAMVMSEYAGGGGTNAVQYANGGTMNGDLNVNGNYLSAGVNLTDIFALQPDLDNQTLSFNDANYDLSISGGNTVNLSAINTTFNANSSKYESNYTTSKTNSANWSSVYTTVNTNSATYILDGGNTKGASIVVGSNDSFNLNIETNNTNRISILSSGETKFLTKYNLLSTAVPSVEFSSGIIVGTDVASLSSYNTPRGYNIGQFSTNGLLIGQNDIGNYIGRTNVKENLFSLPNIENNFVTKLNTSIGNFQDLSISSDGRYITICNYRNSNLNGVLYTSNNFGSSFTARTINGDVTKGWLCTAMSIDGRIQVASSFSSVETGIFVSEDYGETWNLRFTQAAPFATCVSSDGRIQAAAVGTLGTGGGALRGVYMSYDFGKNWVKKFDLALDFETIKMSSDGRIITAAVESDGTFLGGGHIYTSHDFGNTWVQRTSSTRRWTRLAMSADGKNQSFVVENTTMSGPSTQLGVYVSNDYGITWNNTLPQVQACDVCMTSSGKTQLVIRGLSFLNDIVISNNYGASWSQLNTAPSTTLLYSYIACSSDGKVVALGRTSYSGVGSSQLDVYYATFITPNPITINNTISSSNIIFALQGNSNQWNSNYTTTNTNSGKWNAAYAYTSTFPLLTAMKITGINLGSTGFTNAFAVPAGKIFVATGLTVVFDNGTFINTLAGAIRLTRNNVQNPANRIMNDLTIGISTFAANTMLRRSSNNDNNAVAQAGETVQIAMNVVSTAYTATVLIEGVLY